MRSEVLHDTMQAKEKEAPPAAAAAAGGEYVPLPLIGKIREKGFSAKESSGGSRHWHRVSAPEPRATPFPIARHRSDGPHWAPPSTQPVQSADAVRDDLDDKDSHQLASKAQPLVRKKKNAINFSKWKAENASKEVTNLVRGPEIRADVSSAQSDAVASNLEKEEDKTIIVASTDKSFVERKAWLAAVDSSLDSRDPALLLPQLSTSFSSSETKSRSPTETSEDISSIDESALESMTIEQIAEAQQELAERFRPDILDMLRRRGKEKAEKQKISDRNLDTHMEEASSVQSKVGDLVVQHCEQSVNASAPGFQEAQDPVSKAPPSVMQANLGNQFEWEGKCWTERVEAVRTYRFGLDGDFVGSDPATVLPTTEEAGDIDSQWKIPNVTERDFLRMEGDPSVNGYTIKEAVALARSMVPAQRSAALRLISNILNKAMMALQSFGGGESFDMALATARQIVDWQAVWAYALGPEPELVLSLRIALDDAHATAVVTCARALEFLLSSSANEQHFNLCESSLPIEYHAFTAPIFQKPLFQESGLMGDCFWKYNVKPRDMFPYTKKSQSQGEDTDATVKDDAFIANQDVAAGVIRMGILPRIRYLLEVERLTSAEDSLFSILIALSRHSPAAADAVMNCPRLMSTIHELFVHDETLTWSARPKAIRLLKVLSIAKKSNCIEFFNMGTFERSQLGLLRQALSVGRPKGPHDKSSAELVESLRFWRVCVKYGLCISCFSDYYPALLFWIATPSSQQSQMKATLTVKDATLTEAAFHVLEALANSLPVLHGSEDLVKNTSDFSTDLWSWKFAIPIVEGSLGWLSLDFVQGCTHKLMQLEDGGHQIAKVGTQISLRVVSSVLHFLSSVCERILEEGNVGSTWLPTFVPKVGLQLIRSGMLRFSKEGGSESTIFSLVECFSSIRQKVSEEYLLDVMNCLHGLMRLLKILDRLLASVRVDKQFIGACNTESSWVVEEILKCGLTMSAKEELLQLLKDTGDDLIQKSSALNIVSTRRRGGPAPGVGIGWGCRGGGHWSHQMLTTQVESFLVQELTELLSLKGLLSEGVIMEPWRLKVGLSIMTLAGPYHRGLVEKVCRDAMFREISIHFYIRKTDFLVKRWSSKLEKSKNPQQREKHLSNMHQDVSDIRGMLLQHATSMWLSQKVKHTSKEAGGADLELARKGTTFKRSSVLSTIPEDDTIISPTSNKESLAVEWAGQKLPLPSLWFLSPLLSNAGLDICDAGEVVRHGLIPLCGMEALMESFPLHIPVVRKLHSLSNIFVVSDDVFLESGVNYMVGALQEKYMCECDVSIKGHETMDDIDMADASWPQECVKNDLEHKKLDFEGLVDERYSSFLDKLISQFASVSYGDLVFSRQVAIYLSRDVSESLRLKVWKSLESEHMLEFLPPLEQCCGPSTMYLYPIEDSQDMLKAYVSSWVSGALERARVRHSVSFSLAAFHVAAFIFSKHGDSETESLRKTFAKNLLLQVAQRPQFQESVLELLDPKPMPYGEQGRFVPPSADEIKLRCKFLEEACAQYPHLIDKIQQLKNAR